jgi:hypothetical protein
VVGVLIASLNILLDTYETIKRSYAFTMYIALSLSYQKMREWKYSSIHNSEPKPELVQKVHAVV